MLKRYDGPTFSTPCEVQLGSPDFGWCPDNYEISDGQIYRIYLEPLVRDTTTFEYDPASKPSDYKDLSKYGSIEYIEGFGTKALPDEAEVDFPDGMQYIVDRTFSLDFQITDSKIANLALIRALQSGAPVAIWYHTIGGKSFGGNDGVQATMRQVGIVHESGETPLSGNVTFVWKNQYDPIFLDTTEPAATPPGPAPFKVKPSTLKGGKDKKKTA